MSEFETIFNDLHPKLQERVQAMLKNFQIDQDDFVDRYHLQEYNIEKEMTDSSIPLMVQIIDAVEQKLNSDFQDKIRNSIATPLTRVKDKK
jgi:hypothetical protein